MQIEPLAHNHASLRMAVHPYICVPTPRPHYIQPKPKWDHSETLPYLWRLAQLAIVLVVGVVLNAAGVMGAGDSKFIAVAAPFVAQGDVRLLIPLFFVIMLAAVAAHRLAKHTALRRVAPHWISWDQGKKSPMGLALASTLACYLALGAAYGAS